MNPVASPSPSTSDSGRVRVEGTLDMVRASDQSFTLRMPDGRELPGRLVGRPIIGLARVLGRNIFVFGFGRCNPAGDLMGLDADGFMPNDGKSWTISPDDMPLCREVVEEQARRLKQVIGSWPGDETEEEVDRALRELS